MIHTSETLRDAFHYLFPDELPELKRLAMLLPDDPVIVNIGAGSGTSTLALLEARPDATVYTIDIQKEDSPFGCLVAAEKVVADAGLSDRHYSIHEDSKLVGSLWGIQEYGPEMNADMVFIDGDHSYEGCKGDIEIWLNNLKPGGILSIHDYNKQLLAPNADGPHPKAWAGVNEAVDELLVGKYEQVGYVDSLISFRIGGD